MTKDGWRTKSEIRMPKSERNPKPEIRHRRTCKCPGGASGFRASEFGILSDFAIRLSNLFSAAQLLFASCQFRQGHLEAQRDYGSQHHPPPEALLQDAGETNSRAHDGTCGPAAFRGAIYLPDFQGSGGVNIDELRLLWRGIDAEDLFDADAVVVGQIVKPGLYNLTYDDGVRVEKVISVNLSPKESQLVYVASPAALKVWQVDRPAEGGRAASAVVRARISLAGILQQRFWWWMVLGAIVALGFEMALAELARSKQ